MSRRRLRLFRKYLGGCRHSHNASMAIFLGGFFVNISYVLIEAKYMGGRAMFDL